MSATLLAILYVGLIGFIGGVGGGVGFALLLIRQIDKRPRRSASSPAGEVMTTQRERAFCEHFITPTELGSDDEWSGTYCKLLNGHNGPHSALYPDEMQRPQSTETT